jgi:hypothetical protein
MNSLCVLRISSSILQIRQLVPRIVLDGWACDVLLDLFCDVHHLDGTLMLR